MDSIHQARLAQSVEHQTLNRMVVGSSPTVDKEFFILYFVASDALLAGRLAPCKWNQAWRPSELYMCIERERKLILRTVLVVYLSVPFLLKSSYTLLRIMLETVCIPPLTSLICEIKTRGLILLKYQVILVIEYAFIIKVINYALWHTFESNRYMYFHNKTWYTCTRCYM